MDEVPEGCVCTWTWGDDGMWTLDEQDESCPVHAAKPLPVAPDVGHLLSSARMLLDRVAEGRDVTRSEAGILAQRIVDVIGHSVTDEPPHLLLSVEDMLRYADAHRHSRADCPTCPSGQCYEWWTILRDDLRRLLHGWDFGTPTHRPFTDDGVTYCGWDGHDGCGEVWPCSTVRAPDNGREVQS